MLYVVAHFAATDDTQTLWAEALYGVAHFARWAEAWSGEFLVFPYSAVPPPPPPECVIADSPGMAAPPGGAGIVWQTPANPPESHDYIIRNGK